MLIIAVLPATSSVADPLVFGGAFDISLSDSTGPASALTQAHIDVPDTFAVADLDVYLDITHPSVSDLALYLQSPAGGRIPLNLYEFNELFEGADYSGTFFDDESPTPIEQAVPPFTGRFRPEAPYMLSTFDGDDPFGRWTLDIYDNWPGHSGTLNSFELHFTTPEPSTLLLLSVWVLCRCTGRRR